MHDIHEVSMMKYVPLEHASLLESGVKLEQAFILQQKSLSQKGDHPVGFLSRGTGLCASFQDHVKQLHGRLGKS